MRAPLQITFHGIQRSPALERVIRARAKRLDKLSRDIISCRVVVEAAQRNHRRGNLYHVAIDMRLRNLVEIVVTRTPRQRRAHADIYVVVRDAFDAARRRIEDRARRRRPQSGRAAAPHARAGYAAATGELAG